MTEHQLVKRAPVAYLNRYQGIRTIPSYFTVLYVHLTVYSKIINYKLAPCYCIFPTRMHARAAEYHLSGGSRTASNDLRSTSVPCTWQPAFVCPAHGYHSDHRCAYGDHHKDLVYRTSRRYPATPGKRTVPATPTPSPKSYSLQHDHLLVYEYRACAYATEIHALRLPKDPHSPTPNICSQHVRNVLQTQFNHVPTRMYTLAELVRNL